MSNVNYTSSSLKDEIKEIISKFPHRWGERLPRLYPELLKRINDATPKLQDWDYSLPTKIYWILNDISDFPTYQCYCGEVQKAIHVNISLKSGYTHWLNRFGCCTTHARNNPIVKELEKQHCIEKRGVDHPSKTQQFKDKTRETWNRKSQQDKELHIRRIKQTKKDRYNDENYNNSKQALITNINNHGGVHANSSSEVKHSREIHCEQKYGVKHTSQLESVKKKILETHIERHGGIGFASEEICKKCEHTNLTQHGDKHFVNISKRIETVKAKSKNDWDLIVQKRIKTFQEHFGVDNPMQLPEFRKKCNKKWYLYFNDIDFKIEQHPKQDFTYTHCMKFDSKWEIFVFCYCKLKNIQCEYSPNISISYKYDGKQWTYHPDFLIEGKLYEVKGDQFFRINETTGKEEMFCPWRSNDESDDEYKWKCGKEEAKHQCILANNITILRRKDIRNIVIDLDIINGKVDVNDGNSVVLKS